MNIYLQGLTMGLAYVAPIGLQNLFVINSALTQKRSRVYITALIVIFWDISLGVACFLGAGALMQALPWLQKVIPRHRAAAVQGQSGGRPGRERPHLEAGRLRFRGHLAEPSGHH